jgi:PTH1 family peptidyl-tRNA hydrolase
VTRRIVIGIGNPGPEYEGTHHNLGFDVVRLVAARRGLTFRELPDPFGRGPLAEVAQTGAGEDAARLVLPLTYVNRSGRVFAGIDPEAHQDPARVLVVCDDLALPVGRLRLRPQGSDGGHKGLRSIEEALGSSAYPRLRIGIGRDEATEVVEHVLARPSETNRERLEKAVAHAARAVLTWLDSAPMGQLMAEYNAPRQEG